MLTRFPATFNFHYLRVRIESKSRQIGKRVPYPQRTQNRHKADCYIAKKLNIVPAQHPENKDVTVNIHPPCYSHQFWNVRMLMTQVLLADSLISLWHCERKQSPNVGDCSVYFILMLLSSLLGIKFILIYLPHVLFAPRNKAAVDVLNNQSSLQIF